MSSNTSFLSCYDNINTQALYMRAQLGSITVRMPSGCRTKEIPNTNEAFILSVLTCPWLSAENCGSPAEMTGAMAHKSHDLILDTYVHFFVHKHTYTQYKVSHMYTFLYTNTYSTVGHVRHICTLSCARTHTHSTKWVILGTHVRYLVHEHTYTGGTTFLQELQKDRDRRLQEVWVML